MCCECCARTSPVATSEPAASDRPPRRAEGAEAAIEASRATDRKADVARTNAERSSAMSVKRNPRGEVARQRGLERLRLGVRHRCRQARRTTSSTSAVLRALPERARATTAARPFRNPFNLHTTPVRALQVSQRLLQSNAFQLRFRAALILNGDPSCPCRACPRTDASASSSQCADPTRTPCP